VVEMLNMRTYREREAMFRHLYDCDPCRWVFIQLRRK
jgi:hypothetical protein